MKKKISFKSCFECPYCIDSSDEDEDLVWCNNMRRWLELDSRNIHQSCDLDDDLEDD